MKQFKQDTIVFSVLIVKENLEFLDLGWGMNDFDNVENDILGAVSTRRLF